ncbi:MAG: hypothetical protein KU38_08200 [Sulfurovum sp. FS08-3]|nr:MAG: hypothetical protein KU38_08200 [Sulfurovum sp. FS08-3]
MEELKTLRDIKPLVDIPDSSIYIYWALIGVGVVLGLLLLSFVLRKLLSLRKENKRKIYIQKLHAIDFKEAKQSAYEATHYGRLVAQSDREKEIYSQLLPYLERYKYRKIVEKVDSDTQKQFRLFLQVIEP